MLYCTCPDYITNTDMLDLENALPNELDMIESSGTWGSIPETQRPPATGPGPGQQNGALDSELRQHIQQQQQLSHHLLQQAVSNLQNNSLN